MPTQIERHHERLPARLSWVDGQRRLVARALDPTAQRTHGQFFTPASIAWLMASMLPTSTGHYRLLDPGAGMGALSAAAILRLVAERPRPDSIHLVAYEIDESLVAPLREVLVAIADAAIADGVPTTFEVVRGDFMVDAARASAFQTTMGGSNGGAPLATPFTAAILNPPYGKLGAGSPSRELARAIGVEAPNFYAAFWAAAVALTATGGNVVAVTPRSFCNGTYFHGFRRYLLARAAIRRLHVFDARDGAFSEDGVLQENLVTHLAVGGGPSTVTVTAQETPETPIRRREVPYDAVVSDDDPMRFIHIAADEGADAAASFVTSQPATLATLGLEVSTGPVVDFRVTDLLRHEAAEDTVPLLYPAHVRAGSVVWPAPRASGSLTSSIVREGAARRRLLVPAGSYVLVRRFSAKEEPRRVVAALHVDSGSELAIENHLNYFHECGRPMAVDIARGLVTYLNSAHVDTYVRRFSGHTQVNAGDLRSLRYPARETLAALGECADNERLAEPDYYDELAEAVAAERV